MKFPWLLAGLALLGLGLSACQPAQPKEDPDIQTLHASTLTKVMIEKYVLGALFLDGEHALLTSSLFETDRLFLVDLRAGRVQTLTIPKMNPFMFMPVHNGIIVTPGSGKTGEKALWVSSTGETKLLEVVDVVVTQMGNDAPRKSGQERFEELRRAGELTNLTDWQAIDIQSSRPGPTPRAFYNDRLFIAVNYVSEPELSILRGLKVGTFTHDYRPVVDPVIPGLDVEVQRQEFYYYAGTNDNRRIQSITLRRGGQIVKKLDLKGIYFDAPVIGNRLYLIGDGVRYLELGKL